MSIIIIIIVRLWGWQTNATLFGLRITLTMVPGLGQNFQIFRGKETFLEWPCCGGSTKPVKFWTPRGGHFEDVVIKAAKARANFASKAISGILLYESCNHIKGTENWKSWRKLKRAEQNGYIQTCLISSEVILQVYIIYASTHSSLYLYLFLSSSHWI